MASYGPERSFLLIFSARDHLVKVSWKSDTGKCQKQITLLSMTIWVKGTSPFVKLQFGEPCLQIIVWKKLILQIEFFQPISQIVFLDNSLKIVIPDNLSCKSYELLFRAKLKLKILHIAVLNIFLGKVFKEHIFCKLLFWQIFCILLFQVRVIKVDLLIISRPKKEINSFKRLSSALQHKPRCFPTWKALLPANYEFKKDTLMAGKLFISDILHLRGSTIRYMNIWDIW